ncbi:MAG: phosphatase domain-containing protein [Deinococcota bacterium]
MTWQDKLTKTVYKLESGFDRIHHKLRHGLRTRPLMIQPYLGYGNSEGVLLRARVLADKGIRPAREEDSLWDNFKNAVKRLESSEYPGASVAVKVYAHGNVYSTQTSTDNEGFVYHWLAYNNCDVEQDTSLQQADEAPEGNLSANDTANINTPSINNPSINNPSINPTVEHVRIHYKLLSPERPSPVQSEGYAILPRSEATFGIISDVDDTVLQTGATSTLSMIKKVLFGNARTRLPFVGAAAFYQALCGQTNPIFYVSSSPWNLYDMLTDFFDINDIPAGPLMLRDWGIKPSELLPFGHKTHKLDSITGIMEAYPDLPFVLIGDSGQEDPEIYTTLVSKYPSRIKAIYIRDVSSDTRDTEIAKLQEEVAKAGCPLRLVKDTLAAATHAAELGLINQAEVETVRERQSEDMNRPLM